jgi:hypothetical protein
MVPPMANDPHEDALNAELYELVLRWPTHEDEYQVGMKAICDGMKAEVEKDMAARRDEIARRFTAKTAVLQEEILKVARDNRKTEEFLKKFPEEMLERELRQVCNEHWCVQLEGGTIRTPVPGGAPYRPVAARFTGDHTGARLPLWSRVAAIDEKVNDTIRQLRQRYTEKMNTKIADIDARTTTLEYEIKEANEQHDQLRQRALRDAESRGRAQAALWRQLAEIPNDEQADLHPTDRASSSQDSPPNSTPAIADLPSVGAVDGRRVGGPIGVNVQPCPTSFSTSGRMVRLDTDDPHLHRFQVRFPLRMPTRIVLTVGVEELNTSSTCVGGSNTPEKKGDRSLSAITSMGPS